MIPRARTSWWLVVALASVFVGACGDDDTDTSDPGDSSDITDSTDASDEPAADDFEEIVSDVERADADATAAPGAAQATLQLGLDVLGALAEPASNAVLSPFSIEVALAMTRVGAAGDTRAEMDAVLHADMATDLDGGLNALDQALAGVPGRYPIGDDEVELDLSTANAIWPMTGLSFEQPFLDTLAGQYGAGVNALDYVADPSGSRETINGWVADRTDDLIPELIPDGVITTATRMVLTNAIHLKAPWALPFNEGGTSDEPWTRLDGTETTAPLMAVSGSFPFATGDGYQAIALPYAGDRLSMLVVVPDEGRFDATTGPMTAQQLEAITADLDVQQVALRFPTFEMRTQTSLKDILIGLGMPTAFSGAADFSAMTNAADLAITDVVHEGFITVDEEGTEAAAATAVIVGETAAPQEFVELTVDRPFLFLIHDTETGAPLFLGQVLDPGTGS